MPKHIHLRVAQDEPGERLVRKQGKSHHVPVDCAFHTKIGDRELVLQGDD